MRFVHTVVPGALAVVAAEVFAQPVSINLGTLPNGATNPSNAIIDSQWQSRGILFSARRANEPLGQQGTTRPFAGGSGPGPCGRYYFFTPDVSGAVGIFRFVEPASGVPTDATFLQLKADFDSSSERLELIGFDAAGAEVVRKNQQSPCSQCSVLVSISGAFRFAELRTFGNPGIGFNGDCAPIVFELCGYANCDGSSVPPVLNVNDFQCFLNKYAAGQSYANCDASTSPPVLNVNDFTCFLNKFAGGCP